MDVRVNPPAALIHEIQALCADKLSIRVPSPATDLFATGLLDSMSLVRLVLELEQRFEVELPMEELDLGSFRTLESVAELMAARRNGGAHTGAA